MDGNATGAGRGMSVKPGSVQEYRLRCLEWAAKERFNLTMHHDVIAWRVRGEFDPETFATALRQTAQRHDALTATYAFKVFGESPAQVMRPDVLPAVQLLSTRTEEAARDAVRQHAALARPVDFAPQLSSKVLRLSPVDHVVSIALPSMIMMDHWSYDIFVRDLAMCYSAIGRGESPNLEEGIGAYQDFAEMEYDALRGGSWSDSTAFWVDAYAGEPPPPALRTPPLGSSEARRMEGGRVESTFGANSAEELREAWRQWASVGVSKYAYMLSSLLVVLHRLTGERDQGVLVPAANRDDWRFIDTVGLFATIIAPRFRKLPERTFGELCEHVRDVLNESLAHQRITYHEMLRILEPARYGGPTGISGCYFDFWTSQQKSETTFGVAQAEEFLYGADEQVQHGGGLALNLYDDHDVISCVLTYGLQHFATHVAASIIRDLELVALAAARHPDALVATLAAAPELTAPRLARP